MRNKNPLPIKVSAVKYLNTLPFIYGLQQNDVKNDIVLSLDSPADTFEKLKNKEVDVGLVPVVYLLENPTSLIQSSFCIGSKGVVESVLLCSQTNLNEISKIYLDAESRTSSLLVQLLAKHQWNIYPVFEIALPGFETNLSKNEAALIIGDRALKHKSSFKYTYDLSNEWHKLTGMPFVFACWISNTEIDKSFIDVFNHSLSFGIDHIDESVPIDQNGYMNRIEIIRYLKESIDYKLDAEKVKAMETFLRMAKCF